MSQLNIKVGDIIKVKLKKTGENKYKVLAIFPYRGRCSIFTEVVRLEYPNKKGYVDIPCL